MTRAWQVWHAKLVVIWESERLKKKKVKREGEHGLLICSLDMSCLLTPVCQTLPIQLCGQSSEKKAEKRPLGAVFWLIQPTNNVGCVSRAPSPSRCGSKSLPSLLPLLQTVDTSWWVKGVQRAMGGGGEQERHGGSNDTWQRGGERALFGSEYVAALPNWRMF